VYRCADLGLGVAARTLLEGIQNTPLLLPIFGAQIRPGDLKIRSIVHTSGAQT
jgi:hypothetical protein